MKNFGQCNKCHRYGGLPCTCKSFKIYHKDYLDDGFRTIYAIDEQKAAELYAEATDSEDCDYTCVQGSDLDIEVEDENRTRTKWRVTGETQPIYTANEVEPIYTANEVEAPPAE